MIKIISGSLKKCVNHLIPPLSWRFGGLANPPYGVTVCNFVFRQPEK
ncbi:MAG: hypothetical protein IKZ88_02060 [Neisseriaceae bacterium]|nr:hypothetical protein [Neisseriaceae bacterium]